MNHQGPIYINTTDQNTAHPRPSLGYIAWDIMWYSALPIYRGLFPHNNSREAPTACPLGQAMGVSWKILVWPKFYQIKCNVCGIVLYDTAIYWESIACRLLGETVSPSRAFLICMRYIMQSLSSITNLFVFAISACSPLRNAFVRRTTKTIGCLPMLQNVCHMWSYIFS